MKLITLLLFLSTQVFATGGYFGSGGGITQAQLDLKANLASPTFTGTVTVAKFVQGVVTLVDEATPALNAASGGTFVLTATGNRTIAIPTNPTSGQVIRIRHEASGGARTLSLNTGAGGFRFGTDISGLTATDSGKSDYITCIYDATDGYWDIAAVVKGY